MIHEQQNHMLQITLMRWGTYGRTPDLDDLHIQWVKIKDLANSHIKAILETQLHVTGKWRRVFETELLRRQHNKIMIESVGWYPNYPIHKAR